MVYEEIIWQGQLFLRAIILGAELFLLYDFFRVLRRLLRHGVIGIAIEDMIFWLYCAFSMFGFMYQQNSGAVRGFIILGAVIGMVLYTVFVSRYVVKIGTGVLHFIVRLIWRIIGKPFLRMRRICEKSIKHTKKRLKKASKAVRMGINKL